jgi:hypothetical protein
MIIEKAKRVLAECPGWNSEDNLFLEADPEKCRAILILEKNNLLTAKVAYDLVVNLSSSNLMVEVINKLSRCNEKDIRKAIIAAYTSRHFAKAVVGLRSVQSIIELAQVINELESNNFLLSKKLLGLLTYPFNQTIFKVKAILELSKKRHYYINFLNETNLKAIFSVPEVSKAIFILMKYNLIPHLVERCMITYSGDYAWTDSINQPIVAKAILALENSGLLNNDFWIFTLINNEKLAQAIVVLNQAKLLNAKTFDYVQLGGYPFKNEYTSKDFMIKLSENKLLNPISILLFEIASTSDFAHGFIQAISNSTQEINKQMILELWQTNNEIDQAIKELYRQDLITEERLSLLTQTCVEKTNVEKKNDEKTQMEKTKLPIKQSGDNFLHTVTLRRTTRKESISFAQEVLGIFSKRYSDEVPESDDEEKAMLPDIPESDTEESKCIVRKPPPSVFEKELTVSEDKYKGMMKNSMLEREQFQNSLKAYNQYRKWGVRNWKPISPVSAKVISEIESAQSDSERYKIALHFVEADGTKNKPFANALKPFVKRPR